jgi:hypothetical protein
MWWSSRESNAKGAATAGGGGARPTSRSPGSELGPRQGRQGRGRLRREAKRASVDSVKLCKPRNGVLCVRECTTKLGTIASMLISACSYCGVVVACTEGVMFNLLNLDGLCC